MSPFFKAAPLLASAVAAGLFAPSALADEDSGLYAGAGFFTTTSEDCSSCGYSGQYVEAGYDFNEITSVEFKYGREKGMITIAYAGLNLGHDFNTDWFRFYGKLGVSRIDEDNAVIDSVICNEFECIPGSYTSTYRRNEFTAGIGARFTFSGKAQGFYAKLESTAVSDSGDDVSAALMAGIGYRF